MVDMLNSNQIIVPLITIVLLLVVVGLIVTLVKLNKLTKNYKAFTTLSGEIDVESVLISNQSAIKEISKREKITEGHIKALYDNLKLTFEKMAITKYNAFDGMGGQLSAVIVLLNKKHNGYLINSIHTSNGNHMYVKEIKAGTCEQALSDEESATLKTAMTS